MKGVMSSRVARFTDDRVVLSVVLLLVAALLASWVGLAMSRGGSEDSADSQSSAALAAARKSAISMTTYDYRQLDRDYSWVNDGATPSFAKQYRDANKPLRTIVEKLKATAVGTISESAVETTGDTKVEVLIFLDQKITNKSNKQTRTEKSRVVMSMVKRDGKWLVNDVQLR